MNTRLSADFRNTCSRLAVFAGIPVVTFFFLGYLVYPMYFEEMDLKIPGRLHLYREQIEIAVALFFNAILTVYASGFIIFIVVASKWDAETRGFPSRRALLAHKLAPLIRRVVALYDEFLAAAAYRPAELDPDDSWPSSVLERRSFRLRDSILSGLRSLVPIGDRIAMLTERSPVRIGCSSFNTTGFFV